MVVSLFLVQVLVYQRRIFRVLHLNKSIIYRNSSWEINEYRERKLPGGKFSNINPRLKCSRRLCFTTQKFHPYNTVKPSNFTKLRKKHITALYLICRAFLMEFSPTSRGLFRKLHYFQAINSQALIFTVNLLSSMVA